MQSSLDWLKTVLKIECSIFCDMQDEILLIRNTLLSLSNAHFKTGMKDIDSIKVFFVYIVFSQFSLAYNDPT